MKIETCEKKIKDLQKKIKETNPRFRNKIAEMKEEQTRLRKMKKEKEKKEEVRKLFASHSPSCRQSSPKNNSSDVDSCSKSKKTLKDAALDYNMKQFDLERELESAIKARVLDKGRDAVEEEIKKENGKGGAAVQTLQKKFKEMDDDGDIEICDDVRNFRKDPKSAENEIWRKVDQLIDEDIESWRDEPCGYKYSCPRAHWYAKSISRLDKEFGDIANKIVDDRIDARKDYDDDCAANREYANSIPEIWDHTD